MAFEQHCVVEVMGHLKLAGLVTEQEIAGQQFVRVDVPETRKRPAFTRFFGTSAIYSITPVEEKTAQAMAEALNEAPIQEWRIAQIELLPSGNHGADDGCDQDEDDCDDDFWDEDDCDIREDFDEPVLTQRQQDRQDAVEWAGRLLEGEFVIVDTETTGFDDHDEIIQIGIVDQDGQVVLNQLIKPEQPILNSQYHGITDETVADAPGFPEVYEAIQTALDGKRVVAWNYAYDSKMLAQVVDQHGLDAIPLDAAGCAMVNYAEFYGEWNSYHGNYRWQKLRHAMAQLGLEWEGDEHDAVADCQATLAVIKAMAAQAETAQPPADDLQDVPF